MGARTSADLWDQGAPTSSGDPVTDAAHRSIQRCPFGLTRWKWSPRTSSPSLSKWAVGLVGAVALGTGALLRDRLEWYDAYAEVFVSGLRSALAVQNARTISQVGPYFGIVMVIIGLLVARRRGATLGELARPLVTLGFALLCVE